jgi:two-component system response regulator
VNQRPKGKTVLIVEDSASDVIILEEALKSPAKNISLYVIYDGAEALDFLYRKGSYRDAPRPDLILLDLNLPKIDGREILSRVKSDPALEQIPVIIVTTSSAEDDIANCYHLKANSYITKTIDLQESLDTLAKLRHFWLEAATLPPKGSGEFYQPS